MMKKAEACGIKLFSYPGCDHSLETGNVSVDIKNIHEIMKITEEFIAGRCV